MQKNEKNTESEAERLRFKFQLLLTFLANYYLLTSLSFTIQNGSSNFIIPGLQ